jgi:two-component system, LytTR family, sensor kinase
MIVGRKEIRFNLLFWVGYILYEWLANASVDDEYRRYLINAAVIVPITCTASLLTVEVLLKKFYLKDKKRVFWIGLIVSMIVFILIRRTFNYYYTYPLYFPQGSTQPYLFLPKMIIEGVNIYLIVGVYSMFYFIKAWYEEQRMAHALQQAMAEAELTQLKSQVHPHFIFNTLNNIYSYAIQNNSRTADLIYKLSSFLSYNLYESRSSSIPLTKELEYVKGYIDLEKIRYGDRLDVSINVFNSIEDFNISPLLILPLVENCFKHGLKSLLENCWIRLDISCHNDWLTVKIENSVGSDALRPADNRHGIGLENVARRLQIIYKDNHEFRFKHEETTFFCVLRIKNLESHVEKRTSVISHSQV